MTWVDHARDASDGRSDTTHQSRKRNDVRSNVRVVPCVVFCPCDCASTPARYSAVRRPYGRLSVLCFDLPSTVRMANGRQSTRRLQPTSTASIQVQQRQDNVTARPTATTHERPRPTWPPRRESQPHLPPRTSQEPPTSSPTHTALLWPTSKRLGIDGGVRSVVVSEAGVSRMCSGRRGPDVGGTNPEKT
jgi:hypothetical protein